ncbi:MAG: metallophosphoesterase [Bacteroidales bacterium]|nr:metallophosphoesterase [Bacteroidales bacterium]
MTIALFIALFLFLVPDLYISLAFLRHAPLVWRILLFLPTLIGLFSLAGMFYKGFSSVFGTLFLVALLCFALPKLLFMVISMVSKLLGVWSATAASVTNTLGMATGIVVSLFALYGLTFGWKTLKTKQVDLYFDNLPEAYDGYRIAHLSDLHVGTYGTKTAFMEKVVQRVNDEHPDLVVFTGDLVNVDPSELPPFVAPLSQLAAPDGVFSVLGNHDYCLYGDPTRWSHKREGALKVAEIERSMGWTVLMNGHRLLSRGGDTIAIAGVENTGKPPFPKIGDLKGTVSGITDYDTVKCHEDKFTILLTHDPSHWKLEVVPETHIPLTLCGHTHAAQFQLAGWSPSSWMYKEWGGLYQSGDQQLFISTGLGGTLPFRFGAWPQLVILTLHRK